MGRVAIKDAGVGKGLRLSYVMPRKRLSESLDRPAQKVVREPSRAECEEATVRADNVGNEGDGGET